ncbi:MAG: hypothetical protein ACLFQK_11920 [Fibrobacterota bacterium]
MDREWKEKVLNGYVESAGRWVSIDKKNELENARRKKIEDGFVFYMNEWIPINQKYNTLVAAEKNASGDPGKIVINNTENRQVYNISNDNRTVHDNRHEEHRHLHVDRNSLSEKSMYELSDGTELRSINKEDEKKSISGKESPEKLEAPEDDNNPLLPPAE